MKIEEVFRTINRMKADHGIERYAVGGAVAATFYLEPVSTLDVDIFIELHTAPGSLLVSLDPIFSYPRERGFKREGEHVVISGWPVQFVPPTSPLTEEALHQATEVDVEGSAVFIFTAEHLAAIALQTGRAKDKARLLQFLEFRALEMTQFEKIIERHQLVEKWQQFQRQFLRDE
jgi:hypothetical protein